MSGHENGRNSSPAEPCPDSGLGATNPERMLVNAAHTLCALKRTLRSDLGNFERDLTYRAGIEMVHCYMQRESNGPNDLVQRALMDHLAGMLARDGLGTFEIVTFDSTEMFMEINCPDCLEALGYLSHGDVQDKPSCSFICGLLAGVAKHVFGSTECEGPNEIVATEALCASTGEPRCKFLIGRRSRLESMGHAIDHVRQDASEHTFLLNDEILTRNLDLQNLNLDLERLARKRTEELKRSEERYRSLLNLSPDPVIVCLTDGTIKSMNETALTLFGYGPGDRLESKNISMLLLDGENAWERCIWLVNKEGLLRNQECDFVGKNGGKIVGEVSAKLSEAHPERSVYIVVRDVTERNAMKARTDEAIAECEFYNDLLSHDIANYMSAAMHFLERLADSRDLTDEHRRALAVLARDVKGAYELASVVRDLSKTEDLDEDECERVIDVCGAITEAVEEAKRLYSDRPVTISVDKPAETCYVEGSTLLTRMFVNLLTNAIKFDPSDEVSIKIAIEPNGHKGTEYWSVRITDHGKGIPDQEKERVFDRYYRGDTGVAGAGLGLHVVRKIASACGGLVWAESRVKEDFSKGTVMVVKLRRVTVRNGKHQF